MDGSFKKIGNLIGNVLTLTFLYVILHHNQKKGVLHMKKTPSPHKKILQYGLQNLH